MFKGLCLAAALVLVAPVAVSAQVLPGAGPTARQVESPYAPRGRQVEANGRCGGISYGTGARRCGSRSGGPVGGISGRN